MNKFCSVALAVVAGVCLTLVAPRAQAQVSISIGPAPVCPYGYFDYPPYECAPYGYYGPEWFHGGVFIGAGPWFHGPAHFYGHVDDHFDPHHGYRGEFPHRGDHPRPEDHLDHMSHFHGNSMRDGHGHERGH